MCVSVRCYTPSLRQLAADTKVKTEFPLDCLAALNELYVNAIGVDFHINAKRGK